MPSEIKTIEDLCACKEIDLIRLSNMGKKSLEQINAYLKEKGLSLKGN